MRAWWLLSVALVALALAALVLSGPMPPALRTVFAALVVLGATALVCAVVRRW